MKLREVAEKMGITIDELLDSFTVANVRIDNEARDKLRTFESDIWRNDKYIARNTTTITIERIVNYTPEFFE